MEVGEDIDVSGLVLNSKLRIYKLVLSTSVHPIYQH